MSGLGTLLRGLDANPFLEPERKALLQVEGVHKAFGRTKVLGGVDLLVHRCPLPGTGLER